MKSKVTISRRSSQKGEGAISISIYDKESGMNVVEVEMKPAEFAECITGLGSCEAEMTIVPNEWLVEHIGKRKETKRISVDFKKYNGEKAELDALIEPHLIDGWMVWSDGIDTQQNEAGHTVILYRYVEIEGAGK